MITEETEYFSNSLKIRTIRNHDKATGCLNGKYVEYHPNGNVKLLCFYKQHVLDDRLYFKNSSGKLVYDQFYQNGNTEGEMLDIATI
ncbi:MAG: hypothetical protein HC836_36140 [Richelia sp. RM2_1_2]|nr:hypothetical protein [Richelia sp. RM2_1_2]